MNRSRPHHNIYGERDPSSSTSSAHCVSSRRRREAGYALVSLLAVMTVMALFAMAAAPSIRQQSQRELEKEAIFRGEQVAEAIQNYYIYRRATIGTPGDQALPTSMDQLLEGIPIPGGTKKRQILRVSASRDPLTESGEWGFVRPRTQRLIDFQRSVLFYSGNLLPTPSNPQIVELQRLAAPELRNVLGLEPTPTSGSDEDLGDDGSGPFIGVASRSSNNSVLYYYGIDRHNGWIFTPLFK